MIELKITGDALEVKSEIEKLFNMTSGTTVALPTTKADDEAIDRLIDKIPNMFPKGEMEEDDEPMPPENDDVTPAVDSRGFPWDERIHASSKAINADGTWRNKRGVDSDLLHTVEAELMGNADPVKECVGELIADGKEHETFIEGDKPALPALPAKEYTDKDVTSSMIKMVTALGAVDGSIISPVTQKVLGKFNASAITDIKEQSDRAEFVRMCEAVADNPSQWETIL